MELNIIFEEWGLAETPEGVRIAQIIAMQNSADMYQSLIALHRFYNQLYGTRAELQEMLRRSSPLLEGKSVLKFLASPIDVNAMSSAHALLNILKSQKVFE